MAAKMLSAFDVWITAQGVKSRTRLRSVDNISLEGISRLRELILEFAIQGKLVPQNSKDEPATILLAKMAKEESELVQKKIIKKSKELPPIEESEFPFELPKGWAYTRLNNIGEWGAGATPLRGRHDYYGGEIPWFKSGELSSEFISKSEETVTELALKQTSLRYNKAGDVLIAMYGATIGKSSILEVPATTNQAVCACTPFRGVYNLFLLKLLRAYNKRFISMGAGGAQPNISREKIIATVIALPPLAEQHRIVAKVDELMALCDALEQQETHHLKSHQLLVETLLGTLTRAADANEFQQSWKKLEQHFDDLFTTEDSIDQLKQTILHLAVMGKLVPQNPNDEPASELLKSIAKEKERLVEEGKIRREKTVSEITDEEKYFDLPKGWEWVRMGQVSDIQRGSSPRPKGDPRYFSSEETSNNWISISDISKYTTNNVLMKTDEFLTDLGTEYSRLVNENELIVAVSGSTTGKCCLTGIKGYIYDGLAVIRLIGNYISPNYQLLYMIQHYSFMNDSKFGAAFPNINTMFLSEMLFPFPPLEEQKRIVSKVDELFALCDRLKERVAEAQKVANQMAEAVVE